MLRSAFQYILSDQEKNFRYEDRAFDMYQPHQFSLYIICNGNRTEWSPIRSVIIRVINKIGRPRSGSPICLITIMITDQIGLHEVLLPINHNFNKICDIIGYFLNQNTRNSKFCFAISEKKSHLSMRVMARTVQLLRHNAYCFTKLSN